jgi:hypothetical protein
MDEKSAISEFKAEIDGNVVVALSKPRYVFDESDQREN